MTDRDRYPTLVHMSPDLAAKRVRRLRRVALGHTCPRCGALWALRVHTVDDVPVIGCRYCDFVRTPLLQLPTLAIPGTSASRYAEQVRHT
jgi:Zn ribbon nucleic-acid-binding protein